MSSNFKNFLTFFCFFIIANYSYSQFSISGTIYNDTNGLSGDAIVNGIGFNTPSTRQLYVNLLNGSNVVLDRKTVASNGTFSFTGRANGTYTIQLSINQGTISSAAPATALPTSWVNTGEFQGAGAGNDGTANGLLSVTISGASLTNANLGVEQLPFPINVTGTFKVSKYAVNVPVLHLNSIDSSNGRIVSYKITTLPNNGTLNFRGSAVTVNQIITSDGGDSLTYISDSSYTGSVTF